jgi:hypothetical protein
MSSNYAIEGQQYKPMVWRVYVRKNKSNRIMRWQREKGEGSMKWAVI